MAFTGIVYAIGVQNRFGAGRYPPGRCNEAVWSKAVCAHSAGRLIAAGAGGNADSLHVGDSRVSQMELAQASVGIHRTCDRASNP
jgi:hypothetical protein